MYHKGMPICEMQQSNGRLIKTVGCEEAAVYTVFSECERGHPTVFSVCRAHAQMTRRVVWRCNECHTPTTLRWQYV